MEISKGKLALLVVLAVIAAAAVWKFVPGIGGGGGGAGAVNATNTLVQALAIAVEDYGNTVGSFPQGDAAAIATALTTPGKTAAGADHIAIYTPQKGDLNAAGEFVDAWGTPLRFVFDDERSGTVASAGPDQQFDNGDDIDATFER